MQVGCLNCAFRVQFILFLSYTYSMLLNTMVTASFYMTWRFFLWNYGIWSLWVHIWTTVPLKMLQVIGIVGFMNQRLEIPKNVDPRWASIIESCWHRCVFLSLLNFCIPIPNPINSFEYPSMNFITETNIQVTCAPKVGQLTLIP